MAEFFFFLFPWQKQASKHFLCLTMGVLQVGAGLKFNIPSYLVMHMQTISALLDCRSKREAFKTVENGNEDKVL